MKNRIRPRRANVAVCLLACLVFAGGSLVVAGPVPMPLEAELDLAEHVVVGELTHMQETDLRYGDGVRWGRATVAVRQTLKGPPAATQPFLAATWVDPDYGGASPPQVYGTSDSGIWLVMPNGLVNHPYGRLDARRKDQVEQTLKWLAARQWSAEVHGLQAWADVVQYGDTPHTYPVIIFAVRNVSKADIYYPVAGNTGVVRVRAESPDRTIFKYPALPPAKPDPLFCRKIAPGQIVYLHPDYSYIDMARHQDMPGGEYQVTVSYQNDRDGESATGPAERVPVQTWKGELTSPAVKLVLPASQRNDTRPPASAPADKDRPRR